MLAHKKQNAAKTFCTCTQNTLKDSTHADALLSAYGITPNLSDEEGFQKVLLFGTDILFQAPTLEVAKGWPKEAYVFHFNSPNPWEGPMKGVANHILDIAFLFQNYNGFLPQEQKSVAEKFGQHLIEFVNGRQPWPAYSQEQGGAMVYGPPTKGAEFISGKQRERYGRRDNLEGIKAKIGCEPLKQVWQSFMAAS